mgnify:CR=1 FL=1
MTNLTKHNKMNNYRGIITFGVIAVLIIVGYGCNFHKDFFIPSYIESYYFYDGIAVKRALASTSTKHLHLQSNWTSRVWYQSEGEEKDIYEILKDVTVYGVTNYQESIDAMNSFYTLIAIFLYGFITVIALIGITNIFNTVTTNINLRRREFAILKSIGMTNKEFNRMIRLESFFYGTKSLMIGIPLGCILSYIIYDTLMSGDLIIKYKLPISAIIISVFAVFILITVIMKYSMSKINTQNTIETIRNENI